MIYFDRIEVVNYLIPSAGTVEAAISYGFRINSYVLLTHNPLCQFCDIGSSPSPLQYMT